MIFDIFGPYEVGLTANQMIDEDQQDLWEKANAARAGLEAAIGCYLFGIKHGENLMPWYVGQTQKVLRMNALFPTKDANSTTFGPKMALEC